MLSRDRLKQTYFFLLHALWQEERMLRDIRKQRRLVVLNLHQVRPDDNPFWSPMSPALFEELLAFVAPRFFVTTFACAGSNDTDRPTLIISFDDGYYDYLEYAVPLLRKYRLPSNQNVIGESVVSGRPPALVSFCEFLNAAPRRLIDELRVPGFSLRLASEADDDKARFGTALCTFLKSRPRSESERLWGAIREQMARVDSASARMMTAAEIRQVAGEHEIGCHSYSHDSMGFEHDSVFEHDLARCERWFREDLGLPLTVYAFPNGSYRQSQIEILHSKGVQYVLLVGDDYASHGCRVIHRFNTYAKSAAEVRFRALGYTSGRSILRMAARRTS